MSRRRRRAANPKETLEKVWSLPEAEREAALDRRAKAAAEAFAAGHWPKEEFADGFFDWSHPGASAFAGKLFEAGWNGTARGRPMFALAAEADRRGSSGS